MSSAQNLLRQWVTAVIIVENVVLPYALIVGYDAQTMGSGKYVDSRTRAYVDSNCRLEARNWITFRQPNQKQHLEKYRHRDDTDGNDF